MFSESHPGSQTARGIRIDRGRLVARMLSQCWRTASPCVSGDDLSAIASLITTCGAGGIAWRGLRGSQSRNSEAAEFFHAQYRLQSLQAALHERNLKRVIPLLREADIEPLLVKGWAIARLYPEPGMRPYLDLDLCVLPNDYARACAVLKRGDLDECRVDLHRGFGKFYERRTAQIFAQSRLVKLGELDVRVLSPEDDLRFLCLHLLRHGATQPLWLCDVGLLLESVADDFDWQRCLTGSRRESGWVACAVQLAHQLFGADIERMPDMLQRLKLPDWATSTVLEEWGTSLKTLPQLAIFLRDPRSWLRDLPVELSRHWPNSIEATMTLRGRFNWFPRAPFQVAHMFYRTVGMLSTVVGGFVQRYSS